MSGFALAVLLFFASGFSSLIYQVVWSRLLVFVFGSTTFATASVLSVFMGGLALGSYAGGRVADRVGRPLLIYGCLEGIIGVWAFLVPCLLDAFLPVYRLIWQNFHVSGLTFGLLRFVVAAVVLIPPTACMGGTLPLLSRFVSNNPDTIGFRVGSLYAVNTLGAVCGAALAGFLFLPALGLQATTATAAVINLLLFASVVAMDKRMEPTVSAGLQEGASSQSRLPDGGSLESAGKEMASGAQGDAGQAGSGRENRTAAIRGQAVKGTAALVIAAFAASGAVSMIYEVGWTRALLLVIGSSTYAFTCMLTTFLIGIFLGSLWCARVIDRQKEPLLVFAALEVLVAILAVLAMYFYNYLPIWNLAIGAVLAKNAEAAIAVKFLLSASTFVPLTLGLGATFPAVVKACVSDLAGIGRSVGVVYSANTFGAIVGAFVAGFVLMPWLGVEKALLLAAVSNLVLGALMLCLTKTVKAPIKIGCACVTVLVGFGGVACPAFWDRGLLLLSQPLRRSHANQLAIAAALFQEKTRRRVLGDVRLVYFADGVSSNVGVLHLGDPPHQVLLTNGNIDGGDQDDMATQTLLSALPLLIKPDARDVCIIGWGTGVTAGAAEQFPVKSIIGIELEPKVIEAAKFFEHVNNKPELDPRLTLEYNDGRNYLLASDRTFDVIVSEPSNPWQAGVCNLFSQEFFKICHGRLNEGGILSMWLQTTEVAPSNIKGILSSLKSVFKHAEVFASADTPDLIIAASDGPVLIDYAALKKAFSNRKIAAEMGRFGLNCPEAVLACIQSTTDSIARICRDVPINTDDRNYFEYTVCKTYETQAFIDENRQLFEAEPSHLADVVSFEHLLPADRAKVMADVAGRELKFRRPRRALEWAEWSVATEPGAEAWRIAGLAHWQLHDKKQAQTDWARALDLEAHDPDTLLSRAKAELDDGDMAASRQDVNEVLSLDGANQLARFYSALMIAAPKFAAVLADGRLGDALLAKIASPEEVLKLIGPLCADKSFVEAHHSVLYLGALCHMQLNQLGAAEELLRRFLALEPDTPAATRGLGCMLWRQGRTAEASCWWLSSLVACRGTASNLFDDAQKLLKSGVTEEAFVKLRTSLALWPGSLKTVEALQSLSGKVDKAVAVNAYMKNSKIGETADDLTAPATPPSQNVARLIELFAAGFLLFLVLKKRSK